jgi:hypothetical protein
MARTAKTAVEKEAPATKKPGTALAKWDEILKARAALAKKNEAVVGGEFLSVKGGVLKYRGEVIKSGELDCVVVASILENCYRPGKYDADNPTSPICYSFGRDEKTMKPHEKSEKPQSDSCKTCQWNEYGTADTGRGKACKNIRRLAIIPIDALDKGADGIADADVTHFELPVTSSTGWSKYVTSLEGQGRPPEAVVTQISVEKDEDVQVRVFFKAQELVDDGALIEALLERSDKEAKAIDFPYQVFEAKEGTPKGRAASGKAPTKSVTKPAKRKF